MDAGEQASIHEPGTAQDLRERLIAVIDGGLSCNAATERFGTVDPSGPRARLITLLLPLLGSGAVVVFSRKPRHPAR